MSILEKFVAFANNLPAHRQDEIDAALAALMDSFSSGLAFSPGELTELDRRMSAPKPCFADPDVIAGLLGRSLPA